MLPAGARVLFKPAEIRLYGPEPPREGRGEESAACGRERAGWKGRAGVREARVAAVDFELKQYQLQVFGTELPVPVGFGDCILSL